MYATWNSAAGGTRAAWDVSGLSSGERVLWYQRLVYGGPSSALIAHIHIFEEFWRSFPSCNDHHLKLHDKGLSQSTRGSVLCFDRPAASSIGAKWSQGHEQRGCKDGIAGSLPWEAIRWNQWQWHLHMQVRLDRVQYHVESGQGGAESIGIHPFVSPHLCDSR